MWELRREQKWRELFFFNAAKGIVTVCHAGGRVALLQAGSYFDVAEFFHQLP